MIFRSSLFPMAISSFASKEHSLVDLLLLQYKLEPASDSWAQHSFLTLHHFSSTSVLLSRASSSTHESLFNELKTVEVHG